MRDDDAIRLRHMLDAARAAMGFVHGRIRSDFDRDRQLVFALLKAIEIVGVKQRTGYPRLGAIRRPNFLGTT